MTFTDTSHPLSADGAAVCFANADKHFGGQDVSRLNYFTTDGGGLGTPLSLAFSNLQELQWSAMSNQQTSTSNWSHEVPLAEWVHVAVVNDPADQTTTMYVDGAPILRNVLNVTGIQHDDAQPWILGAGMWGETLTDGWNGCIGETRLVTEPLEESQWLTARSAGEIPGTGDDATDEPTVEPTDEPTPTPSEDPTDVETEPAEPTTEPSESPSDIVAADEDTNNDDDLARTGAGVLWLIAAGAAAIILGTITMMLRRRNAS